MPARWANPLIVAGMALVLGVVAWLQYRWIGELSEAEKARLERTLEQSARRFRGGFNRQLHELAVSIAPEMRELDADNVEALTAERLTPWLEGTPLRIESAWMRRIAASGEGELLRLSPADRSWEAIPETAPGVPGLLARPWRGGGRRGFGGGSGFVGFGGGFGGRPPTWTFLGDGPYLVQALIHFHREEPSGRPQRPDLLGFLFVQLDEAGLRQSLFPQLFAETFGEVGELGYEAAVLEIGESERVIFSSQPDAKPQDFLRAAVRLPLLLTRDEVESAGRRAGRPPEMRREEPPQRPGDGHSPGGPPPPPNEPGGPGGPGGPQPDAMEAGVAAGPGPEWMLLVRHRQGSLDAVVGRLRRRNLAISTGVLALLAVGMSTVLLSTRRARKLAELQMEFVAGVSHELRTPLAVIRSAGDNLAEGVVSDREQVREYGRLIRGEGRRLSGMVEQTLQFAAVQAGKRQYRVETVSASELLRRAAEESRPAVDEAGCRLDVSVPEDLPLVRVDPAAAAHCLQNLIGNAVKYGGEARWVGLSARRVNGAVEAVVSDHGPGIDPQEAADIFEPFYRGKRATEQQIKGNGLGLALARSDAEGFGGKLTVESRVGEGSSFILRMPIDSSASSS
ncbi:MAG: hypothetical protein GC160_07365 [Acidobacteria bacterium]|nr:hypothetical protein [Acidobacteriota bacterium]